jgi:rSAM/selenodomain-associated transferase 1
MPTPANALAIMAKAPLAGAVKSRLVPPLTSEQAADCYRALLHDQLDHLRDFAGAARYLFFAPADAEPVLRRLGGADYAYHAQSDGDLGARMGQVFRDLWSMGHRNIVLIGSDLPALPRAIIEQGFKQLAAMAHGVVLGPSQDGGYFLVGMNRPTPEIFADMTWSHQQVFSNTCAKLDNLKIPYTVLPSWFDVDRVEDLPRLRSLARTDASLALRRTLLYLETLAL